MCIMTVRFEHYILFKPLTYGYEDKSLSYMSQSRNFIWHYVIYIRCDLVFENYCLRGRDERQIYTCRNVTSYQSHKQRNNFMIRFKNIYLLCILIVKATNMQMIYLLSIVKSSLFSVSTFMFASTASKK